MRQSAWKSWIWAVGCVVWMIDGLVNLRFPNKQHAELAFVMAVLFGAIWALYRGQRK
jgi:hypothetical protein